MAGKEKITLYAVGDTAITRNEPETALAACLAKMNEPDIMWGQLECSVSQKGVAPPTAAGQHASPRVIDVLKSAGFDVMSFASNHTLDWGYEGMFDTMEICKKHGIELVGVGKDITDARKPAILDRKGTKVAFLAYCSVLPPSYWATNDKPGCAPVRVKTFYEMIEPHQPGTPSQVYTYANQEDLKAMVEDIKKLRQQADVVVVAMHWGIHYTRAELAMYQQEVGYAAIDAGADLIFGTHPHICKGIEVYKGKVIFHSLGNFAMDSSVTKSWPKVPERWQKRFKLYGFTLNPQWGGYYPFPDDSRKTIMGKAVISNGKIEKVSFIPVIIETPNQPVPQRRKDKGFDEVLAYMTDITREAGLNANFKVEGDEVGIYP